MILFFNFQDEGIKNLIHHLRRIRVGINVPDEIREQLISAKMTCYSHSTDSGMLCDLINRGLHIVLDSDKNSDGQQEG